MMEESSDEQPEMVSREEAEEAEKEASGGTPAGSRSGSATPTKAGSPPPPPGGVPAPSPLPAFLASPQPPSTAAASPSPAQVLVPSQTPKLPTPPPATSSPASVSVTPSRVTPPRQPPATSTAPGPLQTPAEASSATPVSPDTPPVSQHGGAGEGGQGGSLLSWLSSNQLVSKVMEKTKSSVEHVITTLDPGMKEVLYSGGEMDVVVASAKESKVGAVREAFQQTFGRATVTGQESQAKTAAQPVGFTAGLKGAEERIQNLRQSGQVEEGQTVIALEGFIVEMLPDRWFELTCLVLQDPKHRVELQTFSQPTLVPTEYVLTAQDRTPSDYPLRWAGLAVTLGQVIEEAQPHIGRADWQTALSGVSRRESLLLAARALAHLYKQRLPSALAT